MKFIKFTIKSAMHECDSVFMCQKELTNKDYDKIRAFTEQAKKELGPNWSFEDVIMIVVDRCKQELNIELKSVTFDESIVL